MWKEITETSFFKTKQNQPPNAAAPPQAGQREHTSCRLPGAPREPPALSREQLAQGAGLGLGCGKPPCPWPRLLEGRASQLSAGGVGSPGQAPVPGTQRIPRSPFPSYPGGDGRDPVGSERGPGCPCACPAGRGGGPGSVQTAPGLRFPPRYLKPSSWLLAGGRAAAAAACVTRMRNCNPDAGLRAYGNWRRGLGD